MGKTHSSPFNDLGIVPVKYGNALSNTIFADDYRYKKYSICLDNINLLYVALTRAKDVVYGFSIDNPRFKNTIAGVLKNAITLSSGNNEKPDFSLKSHYNDENRVFEYGEIPGNKIDIKDKSNLISSRYTVSQTVNSLKLKLHGENYFSAESETIRKRINYGKLMHEVFEGINTPSDISLAVRKLVWKESWRWKNL